MSNARDTSHPMKGGCWTMLHSSVNIEQHWHILSAGWCKIHTIYFILLGLWKTITQVSPLAAQKSYQVNWFNKFPLHEKCVFVQVIFQMQTPAI